MVRLDLCGFGSNQSESLFTICCYGDMLICQTGTLETRWGGDYFVMTCSPLTPQPPATIRTDSPLHFIWQHSKVNVRDLLWLEEL